MSNSNAKFMIAIWALCIATPIAAVVMLWYESTHPLAPDDRNNLWLICVMPYLLIAAAAWAARGNRRRLWVLLVCTALAAAAGTYTRYLDLTTALWIYDGRAAGGHPGHCGPPQQLLPLVLEFGLAFCATAVSVRILPGQRTSQ
ncbi:MAG: hypothetical protein L0228_09525 [Planctomycetes bacterium]|nr:hypothetical protein [Planctomycetota bacterium]